MNLSKLCIKYIFNLEDLREMQMTFRLPNHRNLVAIANF